MTIFCCLRLDIPPTWRARCPYLYPPETGWPSYTPRHWVPFSSPPATRRVMMDVFDPASTRGAFIWVWVLYYDGRSVGQSVLESDQIFITVRQIRVCWCRTLSLTRAPICRLQLLLAVGSAVIFGSDSRRTCDHIWLSQIQDFLLRRLLLLVGLRWRYWTPPPQGKCIYLEFHRTLRVHSFGKHCFQQFICFSSRVGCRGNMFSLPLSSSGWLVMLNCTVILSQYR
jgi:hypothetical protein